MPKTTTERVQAFRARQAVKTAPAKTAGKRVTRLLVDHPEKRAKFDAFMIQMNRELQIVNAKPQSRSPRSNVYFPGFRCFFSSWILSDRANDIPREYSLSSPPHLSLVCM